MQWSELRGLESDTVVWEIPGHRTKNKHGHLVPLPPTVCNLLRMIPHVSDFVFTTTGDTPVSGFGKAKARLDTRIGEMRVNDGLAPISPWTLHDLRRTMVTVMNEKLGVAPHVVEAVVNHMSGSAKAGVAGVYNRALYFQDRKRALLNWASYLTDLSDRNRSHEVC
jgi:integrase